MPKKDEWWSLNDEGWIMNHEGWIEGFCWQIDKLTDICDCRVAFATEKWIRLLLRIYRVWWLVFYPSFSWTTSIFKSCFLHISKGLFNPLDQNWLEIVDHDNSIGHTNATGSIFTAPTVVANVPNLCL